MRYLLLFWFAAVSLFAQSSGIARRIQSSDTLPGTCPGGGWVFVKTATPNAGLYDCPTAGGAPRFVPATGGAFVARGAWSGATTYAANDIVGYNGTSYVSLAGTNTNHQPDTSPTWWATPGPQGPTGATGNTGSTGAAGASAYVYVAYASASDGTGFTTTFNAALDYIAIKTTTSPLSPPVVGDFAGLWKNYKGPGGGTGTIASTASLLKGDNTGNAVAATSTAVTGLFSGTGGYLKADGTKGDPPGAGDASTNTAFSVVGEMALFSDGTGKLLKRSTLTGGLLKATSGIPAIAVAGTDYAAPNAATTVNAQSCVLGSTCTVTANLPSNPVACPGGQYVSDIAADGTLTCGTPIAGGAAAQVAYIEAAGCNNATAGAIWNLPTASAPTPTCYGTSWRYGALDYADAGNTSAFFYFPLPTGWTGNVDFSARAFVNAISQSVKLTVATVCVAASEDMLNPTFNSAQTITTTSPATANQQFTFIQTTVTTTGCAAGETMIFKVGRDVTDTSTAVFSVIGAEVTIRVVPQV